MFDEFISSCADGNKPALLVPPRENDARTTIVTREQLLVASLALASQLSSLTPPRRSTDIPTDHPTVVLVSLPLGPEYVAALLAGDAAGEARVRTIDRR